MATREKKLWVGRKQNTSSPLPPKEDITNNEAKTPTSEASEDNQVAVKNAPVKTSPAKPPALAKKLASKNAPKKLVKKTIAIKLKPTMKKNTKIKQKTIKAMLNNPKNADTKKKLLKTCVKQIKPKKTKLLKSEKAEENLPPVLEPILPIEEDLENKQGKKKGGRPPRIDNYAKKSSNSDTENLAIDPAKTKRVYRKKPKVESTPTESIDDVMNDLSSLIKSSEMKEEPDIVSESGKSDSLKPKKVIKKKKKENIENTLSKLSPAQRKVIDMLDLNVTKFKGLTIDKRRHSIEKFPIGTVEADAPNLNKISIFNNLPRSISPRTRNFSKMRQSADGLSRRSPYKTRSDSPARLLRNGKQRKLKDLGLLEGLEITHKRRKRNCSEFSGSELSLSKFSGYESDSSFSDLSSVHGAENVEHKDIEHIKTERNSEANDDFSENAAKIKRSFSNEAETNTNFTDTNSNVCLNNKEIPIKCDDEVIETSLVSPSSKVPEKSIILDIMKQTFNDTFDDKEGKAKSAKQKLETVSTENFYKKAATNEEKTEEPLKTEETPPAVHPNSDTPENINVSQQQNNDISIVETTESSNDIVTNNSKPSEDSPVNGNTSDTEPVLQNGHSHTIKDPPVEETPENLAIKENILQALGLQSLKAAKEARLKSKEKSEQRSDYTGTLKAVIKINRGEKKKGKNTMKMLQKNKTKSIDYDSNRIDDAYKSIKEGPSTSWKHSGQSSDTAGAQRKSHYSNRSNLDGSSEHTSDGETTGQEGATKALVIPEKASSFSIHPGRICKDECSYCFGKFGLFDTPCHIAQMKNIERQNKILTAEVHLTQDSCLCDACYRHIDRKANTPSYTNRSYKRNAPPGPRQNHCHVLGCRKPAGNILRRKWMIKMRKKICELINVDLNNPGLHSVPICDEHFERIKHLMVCAMCKRRLAKNHIYYLGPEYDDVNSALSSVGVPLIIMDKPIVCKLCKYYATIILKAPDHRPENSSTFLSAYKKKLLHFNDIVPMDEAASEEPIIIPTRYNKIEKEQLKKKRKISKNQLIPGDAGSDSQVEMEKSDQSRVPSSDSTNQSRPESPSDYMVDYTTLIPSIAMECSSDSESKKELSTKPTQMKKLPRPETVKQAVEISKNMKLKSDKSSDIAVQRLGSNPSISVRQLFPCEEDLPLQGHIEFGNVKERTPEGWEKCSSIIQYDMETKHLWQELQKPYGNQSSFLRHLILLEKYFRNGDLILSPNASHHSINYSESVHNRLRAYDNIPSSAGNVQPISMLPFNKAQKSNSGIITSTNSNVVKENQSVVPPNINAANVPKSTPITISQLNSPPLIPPPSAAPKPKPAGAPPGLISLQPGTNRPVAPLVKVPQSQKIKFPITKNWRPNLIPIDPTKKNPERKAGLVQVISGGKPYHITLEDYKKMCAIKKSFEQKQKRLQEKEKEREALNASKPVKVSYNSVLKSMAPRKGLVISKTTAASSPKNESNESENILEKLDKQVEKLESRLSENKPPLSLPKIPKSLTVIPQTVTRKPSRPSSPVLLITAKPKPITNKS